MNFKNLKPLYLAALGIGLTACGDVKRNVSDVVIYPANIITIDPDMPNATAVAVENGRIIAVDNFESMNSYLSGAAIDSRFSDKTIVPGLIDPHIHMVLGSMMYGLDFVPPWDMETPAGTVKGLPNKASLMAKIAEFESAAPSRAMTFISIARLSRIQNSHLTSRINITVLDWTIKASLMAAFSRMPPSPSLPQSVLFYLRQTISKRAGKAMRLSSPALALQPLRKWVTVYLAVH